MNILKRSKFYLTLILMSVALIGCAGQEPPAGGNQSIQGMPPNHANLPKSGRQNQKEDPYIVGIIGPMAEEIEILHSHMKVRSKEEIAGMTFYTGTLKGQNIVLVQSGIGKVNAAAAAQLLVSEFQADALINSGIAGAVHPDLNLGDIVISTETVQHDMDETAKGYEPGVIPRMDIGVFKADENLISLAQAAAKELSGNMKIYTGRVATGDQFIADEEKKNWIYDTFKPYVVEMEGGAVGQVAYLNQVPYLVIRSASDDAGEGAVMKWEEFKELAVKNSSSIIEGILENMK